MHRQHNRSVIWKEWTPIREQHLQRIKCSPRVKVTGLWIIKTFQCLFNGHRLPASSNMNTSLCLGLKAPAQSFTSSPCSRTHTSTLRRKKKNNSVNKVLRLLSKPQAPDLRPWGLRVALTSLSMPSTDRGRVSDWVPDSKTHRDWQEGKLDQNKIP